MITMGMKMKNQRAHHGMSVPTVEKKTTARMKETMLKAMPDPVSPATPRVESVATQIPKKSGTIDVTASGSVSSSNQPRSLTSWKGLLKNSRLLGSAPERPMASESGTTIGVSA